MLNSMYALNHEVDGWPYAFSVLRNDGVLLYAYDVRFLITVRIY